MTALGRVIFVATLLAIGISSFAVTTTYVSGDDADITLKSVIVSQGKDNIKSIYAKPLSQYLESLVLQDRFMELTPQKEARSFDLDDLRNQAKDLSAFLEKAHSDGLLHLQISKGQMGLRLELGLFTQKSGLLWAYAEVLEKEHFDLDHAQLLVLGLYNSVINQIPYQGLILSRSGNKVTVNRGSLAHLQPDQEIEVVQILGVTRHPQFSFVTHVEKQILGKIKILKTDDSLSFGYIQFEKEPQTIGPGLKLLMREPVFYSNLISSKNETVVEHLLARADGKVIMRGDSKEWIPNEVPTFGRAHLFFGMGSFSSSTSLPVSGGQQGDSSFALNAEAEADLWLTRSWFCRMGINQGSVQVKNPLSGSTPEKINYTMQDYKVAAGYDFEVSDSVYGPRLQALLGYAEFSSRATESTPTSFTSTTFSGLGVGLSGFLPMEDLSSRFGLGAEIWYHNAPKVKEKPVDSGSAKSPQVVELSGSAYYHWKPNIYWMAKLSLATLSADFSGGGSRTENATSSEMSWKRFNGGIEYLF